MAPTPPPQPTVAPTALPAPTATPPPPEPTATLVPAPNADTPADAVRTFYGLVARREYAGAAQLWSGRMQGAFPPGPNINDRFAQTQELRLQRADVVALNQAAGRATVEVELVEVIGNPPVTRRYAGTWQLVRGARGWLLDQPSLRQVG